MLYNKVSYFGLSLTLRSHNKESIKLKSEEVLFGALPTRNIRVSIYAIKISFLAIYDLSPSRDSSGAALCIFPPCWLYIVYYIFTFA